MKVEREDLGGLKYRFTVEVESKEVRKQRERLARAYSHHVKVKGFRPGKVPIELVIRQLGPELEQEVHEQAIQKAFQDALKEHQKGNPASTTGMPGFARQEIELSGGKAHFYTMGDSSGTLYFEAGDIKVRLTGFVSLEELKRMAEAMMENTRK